MDGRQMGRSLGRRQRWSLWTCRRPILLLLILIAMRQVKEALIGSTQVGAKIDWPRLSRVCRDEAVLARVLPHVD